MQRKTPGLGGGCIGLGRLGRHWLLHPLNLLSLSSAYILGPRNLELLSGMGGFVRACKRQYNAMQRSCCGAHITNSRTFL